MNTISTKFTAAVVETKGNVSDGIKEYFFSVGYNEASFIDVVLLEADKIVSNYLYALADFDIDFPLAKRL